MFVITVDVWFGAHEGKTYCSSFNTIKSFTQEMKQFGEILYQFPVDNGSRYLPRYRTIDASLIRYIYFLS